MFMSAEDPSLILHTSSQLRIASNSTALKSFGWVSHIDLYVHCIQLSKPFLPSDPSGRMGCEQWQWILPQRWAWCPVHLHPPWLLFWKPVQRHCHHQAGRLPGLPEESPHIPSLPAWLPCRVLWGTLLRQRMGEGRLWWRWILSAHAEGGRRSHSWSRRLWEEATKDTPRVRVHTPSWVYLCWWRGGQRLLQGRRWESSRLPGKFIKF